MRTENPGWQLPMPRHTQHTVAWQQSQRGGTKEDRMLREITVNAPPLLAEIILPEFGSFAEQIRLAQQSILETDRRYGHALSALNSFLIRTEGVASSKIEHIEASALDYARAIAGGRGNTSAVSMVDAGLAISDLVDSAEGKSGITAQSLLSAHRILMRSDSSEKMYSGTFRTMQNWIGGSDYSPRNALYVPPPADTVEKFVADLLIFANREDVDPLVQATIVHAQFESIHPFTDGNGRIGRALINAVLRRRGVTSHTIVPLASALVANTTRYFSSLMSYRDGDLAPLLTNFCSGSLIAAEESRNTAEKLSGLSLSWRGQVSSRRGSTASRLLEVLLNTTTVTSSWVEETFHVTPRSALAGIEELEKARILTEITGRLRNRVWVVGEVMAELEELNTRIGRRVQSLFQVTD